VEEDKVKSALELAMEKISGLPQLTPEEIAAQKEKEYRPIGEALCKKYLDGAMTSDALPAELARYEGEQGRIARRSLIQSLCRSVKLEDARAAMTALAGIVALKPDKAGFLEEASEDLQKMLHQFEQEKREKSLEFSMMAIRQLESLGISGSALEPNLNENADWLEELAGIRQSYESGMEKLRERLLREAA
jgi:DNA-directed RNA polymerase specialized sigma54-like protein